MTAKRELRGEHALKLYISTEIKGRIGALARQLGRPVADITRTLIWMGLPILEGMERAQERGEQWWLNRMGRPAEDRIEEVS